MSTADRLRWDARHGAALAAGRAGAAAGPSRPAPPDVLRGRTDLLPAAGAGATALDVACGTGTVARWLHGRGYAVDAVDISPVAVTAGRAAAGDPRSGGRSTIRWFVHDLDAGPPAACVGPYLVVVCQRFRAPALYPWLAESLAPGGLLVVSVCSRVGDDPDGGRYRAAPGELLDAFAGLRIHRHTEGDGRAELIATRPG